MLWATRKGSAGVYLLLIAGALAVALWQRAEHERFERAATQALINRARDITSTLGVVVRSQRRPGGIILKERIDSALHDLVRQGELESIAILGATGEKIASAGKPIELTPEMLQSRGVTWHEHTLTLMNLMDLGANVSDEQGRAPSAIVVPDPRVYRPTAAARRGAAETFGRPAWMSQQEYEAVIQKQGVHSLVISLSTAEMRAAVRNDLLLRGLVTALAGAAFLVSGLAWRNVRKSSELQIRLVKAGEMNAHLSEMNFAAAGLAHETRNPLNLIRGHAQMVALQAENSPKLKEYASRIVEEADRVTVQLNEFIHYSKPREAHPAPVELPGLAADVARTLQPDVEDKQLRIQLMDTPLTVEADEALFRQALFNLVLNATQAVAPGGRIEVRWRIDTSHEAIVEVADDGPGVPEGDRTAIFKPYVTMRPKGAGLGLAIVQQIVAAHGWTIACEANEPKGALFRIRHLKLAPGPGGLSA
jgi:signal transduction histidine kinase